MNTFATIENETETTAVQNFSLIGKAEEGEKGEWVGGGRRKDKRGRLLLLQKLRHPKDDE